MQLKAKYYWREWMVASWNVDTDDQMNGYSWPMPGKNNAAYYHKQGKRCLVVTSIGVNSKANQMDLTRRVAACLNLN